jgi:hypothetical protein
MVLHFVSLEFLTASTPGAKFPCKLALFQMSTEELPLPLPSTALSLVRAVHRQLIQHVPDYLICGLQVSSR